MDIFLKLGTMGPVVRVPVYRSLILRKAAAAGLCLRLESSFAYFRMLSEKVWWQRSPIPKLAFDSVPVDSTSTLERVAIYINGSLLPNLVPWSTTI